MASCFSCRLRLLVKPEARFGKTFVLELGISLFPLHAAISDGGFNVLLYS